MSVIYTNGDPSYYYWEPPIIKANHSYKATFTTSKEAIPASTALEAFPYSNKSHSMYQPNAVEGIFLILFQDDDNYHYASYEVFVNEEAIQLPTEIGQSVSGELTNINNMEASTPINEVS